MPEAAAGLWDIIESHETLSDPAKREKYDANMIQSSVTIGTWSKIQKAAQRASAAPDVSLALFRILISGRKPDMKMGNDADKKRNVRWGVDRRLFAEKC